MKRTRILSAAAALLFTATAAQAQAQHEQNDRRGGQDQHGQASPREQQRHSNDDRARAAPAQQRGVEQRGVEQRPAVPDQRRAVQNEEQQRYQQSRQREQGEQFEQAQRRRQNEQIEQTQRREQPERINQDRRAQVNQLNDRDRDYRMGYDFRYNVGGVYRETNQFGMNVLRQALNVGYQQGYRSGLLDRRDGDPADYQRAFALDDGGYGYAGEYVPQSDYAYYLREGFQRGYDDAYWNRARYGTFVNGNAVILGDVVSDILGLTSIR